MKICLDAGHYGRYNQSSLNKEYFESVQMLKLTKYQKQYLEEYKDVEVIMTRTDEKDMDLFARGQKAKGCKLFLSNHSNACGSEKVDYPIVYSAYDNKGNPKEFGLKLSKVMQKVIGTNDAAKTGTRINSAGNNEYYGVMRGARAAGLTYYYIVEHSFHTNKKATNWLVNDSNLKKLAKAEVEAIAEYFGLKKKAAATTTTTTTTAAKSYVVKITATTLNVRAKADSTSSVVTTVKKGEKYTIVEESKGFGKLKSGNGWISLKYTEKC